MTTVESVDTRAHWTIFLIGIRTTGYPCCASGMPAFSKCQSTARSDAHAIWLTVMLIALIVNLVFTSLACGWLFCWTRPCWCQFAIASVLPVWYVEALLWRGAFVSAAGGGDLLFRFAAKYSLAVTGNCCRNYNTVSSLPLPRY